MKKHALGLALVACLFPLTACGGDGGSGSSGDSSKGSSQTDELSGNEQKASDAIAADLKKSSSGGFEVTGDEASCVGDGMVSDLGIDKLQKYKFVDKSYKSTGQSGQTPMSQADAETTVKVFEGCTDLEKMFQDALAEQQMPKKAKDCLAEEMSGELIHDVLVASFSGAEAPPAEFQKVTQKCQAA